MNEETPAAANQDQAVTEAIEKIAEAVRIIASAQHEPAEAACNKPSVTAKPPVSEGVADHSLLIAPEFPCTWPSTYLPPLIIMPQLKHGPGPYASESMVIDEHTGTHWDAPPHFIPPPSTGLPNAADVGFVPSDQVPPWQFVGEACVIDVRNLIDGPGNGQSAIINKEIVQAWEQSNRPLAAGDVVLFHSGYTDKYYKPLPEGRRLVSDPIQGATPAWPGADPECLEYLASRGVLSVGIDSPNIGPASFLAIGTHIAGLKNGMILTENLTNLGQLPATGAFVAVIGPKHANGSGGETRVISVSDAAAAKWLNESARRQKAVDLSVLLREDLPVWWPGVGVGNFHTPYISRTLHTWDQPGGPALVRNHIMDSQTGTHLVPPAYAVPEPGFDCHRYDKQTRQALETFEQKYGPLGTTTITADRVPVSQMVGPARVIDVKHLIGTGTPGSSPLIRVAEIQQHEQFFGPIRQGEIVIFHSAHSDRFFRPFPHGNRCIAAPINGLVEGWPAPEPETIFYLAQKGVACVGTDAPSMGGTDPMQALMTYWAGGRGRISFVEYLIGVGQLPPVGAYFLFAPVKIQGNHGGYGRALALF